MDLVDGNILIYASIKDYHDLREFLRGRILKCSVISKIEVLGYHKLTAQEKSAFELVFENIEVLPLNNQIVSEAISLKQMKKMTLGDSLIAATAITAKLNLITVNYKDFDWIESLNVINPIT